MVVGKNLGADSLQRWLGEQGYPTARLASAKSFRVLESRRPGADSAAGGGVGASRLPEVSSPQQPPSTREVSPTRTSRLSSRTV